MTEISGIASSGGCAHSAAPASSREKILSFTEGNEVFARQIVGEFLRITPPLLENMKKTLAENDLESLKGHCHRIKGDLAYLGEEHLMKVVSEIDCTTVTSEEIRSFFIEMDTMLKRLAKEWKLPDSPSSCAPQSD
ncbi:MAG: Hpt domain-containing protein [Synergistaceae bacterium]|nr:Hpt domain-containing protein [Synergistaceae bacterium]